jgi:hypothetical protein
VSGPYSAPTYITLKFSRKCHNNSKKEREEEEEKGVRRRW